MKVSIITPTLNNGSALARAIDSVVSQDYEDIEMVIVDGGSTDGSLDIIRDYSSRYPGLIRSVSERDGGVYHALNKGIALSTGDVVTTLHGNDRLVAPDVVSRVVTELAAHPEARYLYGDIHYFSPSVKCVRRYRGMTDIRKSLRRGIAPPHPSLYMRRSLVDELGGYKTSYRVAADFELFVRLAFVLGYDGIYLPLDMVAMSVGGLSSLLYNRLITNNVEKMRALRENGVTRSGLGVFRRYFVNLIR